VPQVEATNRTWVIIADTLIEGTRTRVGRVVDCAIELTDLAGGAFEPPPALGNRWRPDYIVGVGRQGSAFAIVLEFERLLGSDAPLIASAAWATLAQHCICPPDSPNGRTPTAGETRSDITGPPHSILHRESFAPISVQTTATALCRSERPLRPLDRRKLQVGSRPTSVV
jgi:hypothetical protein